MSILLYPLGNHSEVARSDAIFCERLEPWAAEVISGFVKNNRSHQLLSALLHVADEDGYSRASYRDLSTSCNLSQANVCKSLKKLISHGLIERVPTRQQEKGVLKILCLKRGAE